MKNKHCKWCDNSFQTAISYQIYCSPECREGATKEKIAEKYAIKRRKKLQLKDRRCNACGSKLSAYNDDTLCQLCLVDPKEVSRALKDIKGFSNGKPLED
jgi:hypothetical protein